MMRNPGMVFKILGLGPDDKEALKRVAREIKNTKKRAIIYVCDPMRIHAISPCRYRCGALCQTSRKYFSSWLRSGL